MTKVSDDLEAVRTIAQALEGFDAADQQRIMRWAAEKAGLALTVGSGAPLPPGAGIPPRLNPAPPGGTTKDIKTFVAEKNPRSDNQFAATVAYYYRFESPVAERKEAISADDLQEACRRAGRSRLKSPGKTLANAHGVGLLDKADRGAYSINAVGENLVAMTLPSGTQAAIKPRKPRTSAAAKKTAKR
jgi:hypothetical protein